VPELIHHVTKLSFCIIENKEIKPTKPTKYYSGLKIKDETHSEMGNDD
jgi:hypothetical protein